MTTSIRIKDASNYAHRKVQSLNIVEYINPRQYKVYARV